MKIHVRRGYVDNQNEAEKFCRDVHGFKMKTISRLVSIAGWP